MSIRLRIFDRNNSVLQIHLRRCKQQVAPNARFLPETKLFPLRSSIALTRSQVDVKRKYEKSELRQE